MSGRVKFLPLAWAGMPKTSISKNSDSPKNKKLYSVQFLRGVASILVVFVHISVKSEQYSLDGFKWVTKVGGSGVDLFFIISGYIMCFTVEHKKGIGAIDFFLARFVRIMPLYWVLTSFALIIYLIKPSMVNSSGGVTDILASYTLLPTGNKYLVGNGWTLSYEFWFYIIFSFSIYFSKLIYIKIVSFFIISLVILGFFVNDNVIINFATNELLLEFVFGMTAYSLCKKQQLTLRESTLIIILGILFLLHNSFIFKISHFRSINYGIPNFFIFLGCVTLESIFSKKSYLTGVIESVGDISYSLYLLHPFVLSPMALVLSKFFDITNIYYFVTTMFVVSIFTGYLSYRFIELPLINWLKPLFTRKNIVMTH